MKVRLLRQNRIDGKAGEIVEVSPARAAFLFEMKLAEPAPIREQIEVPEKKTAAKRTTRAKK
jgi:ribosomal protein L9